jgi:serine/threonine protein kinase
LRKKLAKIQAFVGRHSNTKTKIVPWRVQAMKAAMQHHMGGGIVYLPKKALVVAIPRFGNEGGYGEIRKVRIPRVASIPTIVDFARKMSKAMKEVDKRLERAKEAMACPIEHPGLIKFWAISSVTIEAYTLWWNGGSVRSFWRTNSLVKPSEEYKYITRYPDHPMHVLEKIKAFRTKRAKLTMSLIMTMARVHKKKILYNDISPSNILLHFPPDHVDRVYIGACDWGMATRTIEDVPSVYSYSTKDEMERNKKERPWVALELFYVYGPPNSETSLERVQRRHLYTKEADVYSVGKVAQLIWEEEWDKELFKSAVGASIFVGTRI